MRNMLQHTRYEEDPWDRAKRFTLNKIQLMLVRLRIVCDQKFVLYAFAFICV